MTEESEPKVRSRPTCSTDIPGLTFVQEEVAISLRSAGEECENTCRLCEFLLSETGEVAMLMGKVTYSLWREDRGVFTGKLHPGGDCNELLLPYAINAESGEETSDELRKDLQKEKMPVRHNDTAPYDHCIVTHVVRDLAERETLEQRKGDGERRRKMTSGNRSGDNDGENNPEGVAESNVEQTAETGLLDGRSDEESR